MEIDRALVAISASARGEPGWPPLALFRTLLLATWHDLSDMRLAGALYDRASFHRFCGFAAHEPTPERTTFVRFRRALISRGLDRVLFDAVSQQLDAKGVIVRKGTSVDATLSRSASIRREGEATWAGRPRRKPTHGYKALVATDEGAGLVRGVAIGTANRHDAADLALVLPSEPGEAYGDSAFGGTRCAVAIRATGDVRRRRDRDLGRTICTGAARDAQRAREAAALSYREGIRHLEAQLWPATNGMAWPCQRRASRSPRRDCLQPPALPYAAISRGGMLQGNSARLARGLKKKRQHHCAAQPLTAPDAVNGALTAQIKLSKCRSPSANPHKD